MFGLVWLGFDMVWFGYYSYGAGWDSSGRLNSNLDSRAGFGGGYRQYKL